MANAGGEASRRLWLVICVLAVAAVALVGSALLSSDEFMLRASAALVNIGAALVLILPAWLVTRDLEVEIRRLGPTSARGGQRPPRRLRHNQWLGDLLHDTQFPVYRCAKPVGQQSAHRSRSFEDLVRG